TNTGGTVTANGGSIGIAVTTSGGNISVTTNDAVTGSTNGIKISNSGNAGTNTININNSVKGLGNSASTRVIDITTLSGSLTTLNIAATGSVNSSSANAALQNSDLAIKGTGGNIAINNAGTIRGRMDFSAITAGTNSVTVTNSGTQSWHTSNSNI